MAKRRRTVPHLWNRFIAAVLFVLGTALSTAAPVEAKETRVSKAEATQLEAAGRIGQLSADLGIKLDGAGDDRDNSQPAFPASFFVLADRPAARASAMHDRPAGQPKPSARDGDSRAPPSA